MSYTMSGGKYLLVDSGQPQAERRIRREIRLRTSIIMGILGTIAGTWFGIWCSGPAAPRLRAHGLTLSTWAEHPFDAYAGHVEHARKIRREKR